jgi:hypothetical protein
MFLGAFAELRKGTVSFFMSVRLSAWNNSAPTGRNFRNFIFQIFSKITLKNSNFIKIGHKYRVLYLHEDQYTFLSICCSVIFGIINV